MIAEVALPRWRYVAGRGLHGRPSVRYRTCRLGAPDAVPRAVRAGAPSKDAWDGPLARRGQLGEGLALRSEARANVASVEHTSAATHDQHAFSVEEAAARTVHGEGAAANEFLAYWNGMSASEP